MRSEQEIFTMILDTAKADARVRAVVMNGSRANPGARRDSYQDYDIVFVVRDFTAFTANPGWVDCFGKRLMLQMPEAMRNPAGDGSFAWLMLFEDGSRIDLTLIPAERPELLGQDSQTVVLLDKDGTLPPFPPASDRDYRVTKPSELYYSSCCNNFWWCMQNVAKGIARDELPYAMIMLHTVVRKELHDMIAWYIGVNTGFSVSAGKMGRYFKTYLPDTLYRQYLATYAAAEPGAVWNAVYTMCDLFHTLAKAVSGHLKFTYSQTDEDGMRTYLNKTRRTAL